MCRGGVARVLQEILNRAMEALGNDLQITGGWAAASELDLIEEGATEVLLGDGREAQPKLHSGLTNPGTQLLGRAWTHEAFSSRRRQLSSRSNSQGSR